MINNMIRFFFLLAVVGMAACSPLTGDPAQPVNASAETIVLTDPEVDADDPAIWADAANPSRGVIFATDKTDGLYVHDLNGNVLQFFNDGPLNNVDLRSGFVVGGRNMVLVAATLRDPFGIMTYLFDPETMEAQRWDFVETDMGEPYGFCMGRLDDAFYLVANNKDGLVQQFRVSPETDGPVTELVAERKLSSQTEGCVVDDQARLLYVGEEDVGIWQFDFDPSAVVQATRVASIDNHALVADVEGLTIMRDGEFNYLLASSQGDSAYAVYRIDGETLSYLGRFRVADSEQIDGSTKTDGLDAWSGPIGDYPQGLLVMHDDSDDSAAGQQNFKLVDWREVKAALQLP